MKCTNCNVVGITQKEFDLAAEINGGDWGSMCLACSVHYPPTLKSKKNKYTVLLYLDGNSETRFLKAYNTKGAAYLAETAAKKWLEDMDWNNDGEGFQVEACWNVYPGRIEMQDIIGFPFMRELCCGHVTHTVEPDHGLLIENAGGCPYCDHDWVATYEIEGGMKENPGFWNTGGTTHVYKDHCSKCNLARKRTNYGCQRNPGQMDKVEYSIMKYPIDFSVQSELVKLQDCGAFYGDLNEPDYISELTLDQLTYDCQVFIRVNKKRLDISSNVTGGKMAKFLKNWAS